MKKQSKKNLKQRAQKFFNYFRNNSEYKWAMSWQGSLANGVGPVEPREDGSYDLDIDLASLLEDNAKVVYPKVLKTLKETLRGHEVLTKKKRVFTIYANEDGYKYNFDICIVRLIDGKKKKVLSPKNGGEWINY